MFWLLIVLVCVDFKPDNPVATNKLTVADIPSDLSSELKELIGMTLSNSYSERAEAVRSLRKFHEGAAPAVPFLIQLWLAEPGPAVDAYFALREIGEPAVEPCLAAMRQLSGEKRLSAINDLGQFGNPRMLKEIAALLDLK
jgi:hypothetical protein